MLGDPGEVADRVIGDLRIVGAGLQRQVAADEVRIEGVARQRLQLAQQRRPRRRKAIGVGEDLRPEPNRHGERRRLEVERLAGIEAHGVGAVGLDLADGLAGHQLRDRPRPARQQHLQVLPRRRGQIERHVEYVPLRRRADAGLLAHPVERIGPRQVDRVFRFVGRWRRGESRRRGGADRSRGGSDEEAATRQAAAGRGLSHQAAVATFSAIFESGSCRAWMAFESLVASEAFSASV